LRDKDFLASEEDRLDFERIPESKKFAHLGVA